MYFFNLLILILRKTCLVNQTKDYGNLTKEIIKGEGGLNIKNKNRKYFIGEANKALKRTIHRLTEVCRLHEGASLRNNIWPHCIPPNPAFGGLRSSPPSLRGRILPPDEGFSPRQRQAFCRNLVSTDDRIHER